MKHLCIINPKAGQVAGRVNELISDIKDFFKRNPRMDSTIHVTRWKRDASGYTMRFVNNASEIVRVYAFGGGGTLFEVINGVIGLPNVQVAYFPLGRENDLLLNFGNNAKYEFSSMRNLSLSPVIAMDTILAGNNYVVSVILIGLEAVSYKVGIKLSEQLKLPLNVSYYLSGFYYAFIKREVRHYRIELEGTELEEDYAGIFIGNVPSHGLGTPAPEALFNDGYMDLYLLKLPPRDKIINIILDYQKGLYDKWPGYIHHYRCKKLRITSPTDMIISLDGEIFYDTELNLDVHPSSLNFVCPADIDHSIFIPPPKENNTEKKPIQMEEIDITDLLAKGDDF